MKWLNKILNRLAASMPDSLRGYPNRRQERRAAGEEAGRLFNSCIDQAKRIKVENFDAGLRAFVSEMKRLEAPPEFITRRVYELGSINQRCKEMRRTKARRFKANKATARLRCGARRC